MKHVAAAAVPRPHTLLHKGRKILISKNEKEMETVSKKKINLLTSADITTAQPNILSILK